MADPYLFGPFDANHSSQLQRVDAQRVAFERNAQQLTSSDQQRPRFLKTNRMESLSVARRLLEAHLHQQLQQIQPPLQSLQILNTDVSLRVVPSPLLRDEDGLRWLLVLGKAERVLQTGGRVFQVTSGNAEMLETGATIVVARTSTSAKTPGVAVQRQFQCVRCSQWSDSLADRCYSHAIPVKPPPMRERVAQTLMGIARSMRGLPAEWIQQAGSVWTRKHLEELHEHIRRYADAYVAYRNNHLQLCPYDPNSPPSVQPFEVFAPEIWQDIRMANATIEQWSEAGRLVDRLVAMDQMPLARLAQLYRRRLPVITTNQYRVFASSLVDIIQRELPGNNHRVYLPHLRHLSDPRAFPDERLRVDEVVLTAQFDPEVAYDALTDTAWNDAQVEQARTMLQSFGLNPQTGRWTCCDQRQPCRSFTRHAARSKADEGLELLNADGSNRRNITTTAQLSSDGVQAFLENAQDDPRRLAATIVRLNRHILYNEPLPEHASDVIAPIESGFSLKEQSKAIMYKLTGSTSDPKIKLPPDIVQRAAGDRYGRWFGTQTAPKPSSDIGINAEMYVTAAFAEWQLEVVQKRVDRIIAERDHWLKVSYQREEQRDEAKADAKLVQQKLALKKGKLSVKEQEELDSTTQRVKDRQREVDEANQKYAGLEKEILIVEAIRDDRRAKVQKAKVDLVVKLPSKTKTKTPSPPPSPGSTPPAKTAKSSPAKKSSAPAKSASATAPAKKTTSAPAKPKLKSEQELDELRKQHEELKTDLEEKKKLAEAAQLKYDQLQADAVWAAQAANDLEAKATLAEKLHKQLESTGVPKESKDKSNQAEIKKAETAILDAKATAERLRRDAKDAADAVLPLEQAAQQASIDMVAPAKAVSDAHDREYEMRTVTIPAAETQAQSDRAAEDARVKAEEEAKAKAKAEDEAKAKAAAAAKAKADKEAKEKEAKSKEVKDTTAKIHKAIVETAKQVSSTVGSEVGADGSRPAYKDNVRTWRKQFDALVQFMSTKDQLVSWRHIEQLFWLARAMIFHPAATDKSVKLPVPPLSQSKVVTKLDVATAMVDQHVELVQPFEAKVGLQAQASVRINALTQAFASLSTAVDKSDVLDFGVVLYRAALPQYLDALQLMEEKRNEQVTVATIPPFIRRKRQTTLVKVDAKVHAAFRAMTDSKKLLSDDYTWTKVLHAGLHFARVVCVPNNPDADPDWKDVPDVKTATTLLIGDYLKRLRINHNDAKSLEDLDAIEKKIWPEWSTILAIGDPDLHLKGKEDLKELDAIAISPNFVVDEKTLIQPWKTAIQQAFVAAFPDVSSAAKSARPPLSALEKLADRLTSPVTDWADALHLEMLFETIVSVPLKKDEFALTDEAKWATVETAEALHAKGVASFEDAAKALKALRATWTSAPPVEVAKLWEAMAPATKPAVTTPSSSSSPGDSKASQPSVSTTTTTTTAANATNLLSKYLLDRRLEVEATKDDGEAKAFLPELKKAFEVAFGEIITSKSDAKSISYKRAPTTPDDLVICAKLHEQILAANDPAGKYVSSSSSWKTSLDPKAKANTVQEMWKMLGETTGLNFKALLAAHINWNELVLKFQTLSGSFDSQKYLDVATQHHASLSDMKVQQQWLEDKKLSDGTARQKIKEAKWKEEITTIQPTWDKVLAQARLETPLSLESFLRIEMLLVLFMEVASVVLKDSADAAAFGLRKKRDNLVKEAAAASAKTSEAAVTAFFAFVRKVAETMLDNGQSGLKFLPDKHNATLATSTMNRWAQIVIFVDRVLAELRFGSFVNAFAS